MKYLLIRVLRVLGIFIALLLILSLFLFTIVDRTNPLETLRYKENLSQIRNDTLIYSNGLDSVNVGWSKVSITPSRVLPLAGYGARESNMFSSIHDSIFVRTLILEDAGSQAILVNLDLLIVPPGVVSKLESELDPTIFNRIFFTATHSHSSIGSWQPGFIGELFAGKYDSLVVFSLSDKIKQSINLANQNMQPSTIGFAKSDESSLIRNRLVGKEGSVDPWLRMLKIERNNGQIGYFFTYAGHATCLSSKYNDLSGDYPGELIRILERDSLVDFASYAAGAVGSMSTSANGLSGYDRVNYVAAKLKSTVDSMHSQIDLSATNQLSMSSYPIDLGDPQFKIAEDLAIRSWVFNRLAPSERMPQISSLMIGNTLLIGMPCDFSGELVRPLDSLAEKNGLNLMITSFNGGYVGYITDDKWYDLPKYETRSMNWYGPGNGKLFTELTREIIEKYSDHKTNITSQ